MPDAGAVSAVRWLQAQRSQLRHQRRKATQLNGAEQTSCGLPAPASDYGP